MTDHRHPAPPTTDPEVADRGNPDGSEGHYSGQEFDSGSGPATGNTRTVDQDVEPPADGGA
jgi:hypothetical protein